MPLLGWLLQVCSAVLASALGVAGQNMVHFKQPDELSDPASVGRKLIVTFAWGTSIAIAVAGVNLLPQGAETHHRTHTMAAGTIVVALVAQLLWTALSSGPLLLQKGAEEPLLGPDESLGDSDARVHSIMEREDAPADEPGTSASEEEKALLEEASADVSLLQAWATVDLWLIYAIVSIGTGAGLSLNNNFAQVGFALLQGQHACLPARSLNVP
jgi:hypothetical protein